MNATKESAINNVRTVLAQDADEHACNLTNWEQCYDQTTRGAFQGSLHEMQLPHMQVFCERTNQGMLQRCCVWPDSLWFGLPLPHAMQQDSRINGLGSGQHSIMVRPGGQEFELNTPADFSIYGIVVRQDCLRQAAEEQGFVVDWAALSHSPLLQVHTQPHARCLQTLQTLLLDKGAMAEQTRHSATDSVLEALLPLLETAQRADHHSGSFDRHLRVVSKARDWVLQHPEDPINVPQLCEQLHVSRRTLQYCFEEVTGLSPTQYLRVLRLNGARRQLRQAASGTTVRDVAASWGFWHFSQFASDFRKQFDCSPSQLLATQLH
ncbi:helix-turn-helix domain-containing protein [Curvibacter sp. CHRR-16]|uniref:helix-turn-helix domain-containing protein n=1 Tax=Curvibacter sp. CHRR-16 TaxID=2835872 RepID=UPI001BDAAC2D|nr:helix-turn-helix domain-containing protein [Curvibacter sp. CHRR-16]MBT0569821.1 helix-turn-helix domain-containing protein [Curvibacter sp. CHRR-16]